VVRVNSKQVEPLENCSKCHITLQYSRERRMTCGLPIQLFATENFAKSNTNRNHLAAG